jgi:hypothetical protein
MADLSTTPVYFSPNYFELNGQETSLEDKDESSSR